jgi:chaperonin GroEL
LKDIAVLTGAQPISEELGLKLENVTLADLGRAKRVTLDKDTTTIVYGAGAKDKIKGRIEEIRAQVETSPATTTKKSCKSAWRSSWAASQSSKSARRPRPR